VNLPVDPTSVRGGFGYDTIAGERLKAFPANAAP
jgi:hypothetical protein